MPTLRDGSVIPHFLGVDSGEDCRRALMGGEYALKTGVVSRIFYPGDKNNTNGHVTEYDVLVRDRRPDGSFTISVFHRCVAVDTFGGKGDVEQWTLRPSTDQTNPDPSFHDGSMVIILCMDGDKQNSYIIGGTRHKQGKAQSAENGHMYEFEFNGWNTTVNRDGECTMTYRSKTDNEGVPADPDAGGSFVKFEKDGSVEVSDARGCRVRLDKPTSNLTVESTGASVLVNALSQIREIAAAGFVSNAPSIKIGGDGADEPAVLGNQLVVYINTQIVPKINALIAAVTTLASAMPSHSHTVVVPSHGTITSSGPTPSGGAATGQIPPPSKPSGAPQLSDFIRVKKGYAR